MKVSMNVNVFFTVGVVTLVLGLSGCGRWLNDDKGLIVDRSDDYLDAEVRDELAVPPDLTAERVDDPFAIPNIANPKGATFPDQAPRPVPILAKNQAESVKIQKLGDRRWLVLTEAPSVVWPKLKQFLAENAITTVTEEALQGRITTDWFDVEEDEYRDVIRLAVARAGWLLGIRGQFAKCVARWPESGRGDQSRDRYGFHWPTRAVAES